MAFDTEANDTLVVFDFDDTIVEDSVEYVAMNVAPWGLVNSLLQRRQKCWSQTMDYIMGELHQAGFGREAIMERVLKMEAFSGIVSFLTKMRQRSDLDLMVLSGANTLLINAYLSNIGLKDVFKAIVANNAHFDDCGRMRVTPYHIHQCQRCNDLCKGTVLKEILMKGNYKRVVYIGDGANDVCPTMCLSKDDHVVARELFPLAMTLSKYAEDGHPIQAAVHTVDFKSDHVELLLFSLVQ